MQVYDEIIPYLAQGAYCLKERLLLTHTQHAIHAGVRPQEIVIRRFDQHVDLCLRAVLPYESQHRRGE
jgi:hypothetical protein